jgi:tRNA-splicing ligase RtcB
MAAVQLSVRAEDLPDGLAEVRRAIEAAVPVGFGMHDLDDAPTAAVQHLATGRAALLEKYPVIGTLQKSQSIWMRQMGTLGGGNHFIELCLDETGGVWAMLHSGSRGIGNVIGRHFIALAKEDMLRRDIHLPHRDLAYLEEGGEHFTGYVEAVEWAQDYAAANRRAILAATLMALRPHLPAFEIVNQAINCHHNYISREQHGAAEVYVTRKGAIRAGLGELGIIPGYMGAKSYIVRGLGNPASYNSCSHGAGRRMSRTQAKAVFTEQDLIEQTRGVECRKDAGVIDEAPGAYKDIDVVMANQEDLVEVVHTLKQVLCVKG